MLPFSEFLLLTEEELEQLFEKERHQVQSHSDYGGHVEPVRTFARRESAVKHKKKLDIAHARRNPYNPEYDDPADTLESGHRVRKVSNDTKVGGHKRTSDAPKYKSGKMMKRKDYKKTDRYKEDKEDDRRFKEMEKGH